MASQGPLFPASVVNAGSGIAWVSPGNATTSNNQRARYNPDLSGQSSKELRATNFGFTIPAGATIDGIFAEIEKSSSPFNLFEIQDEHVQMIKGGSLVGDDKPDPLPWPNLDTFRGYGGTTDTWGVSWLDTDVNSASFGFMVQALDSAEASAAGLVDSMRLTVYYTPATIGSQIERLVNAARRREHRTALAMRAFARVVSGGPGPEMPTPPVVVLHPLGEFVKHETWTQTGLRLGQPPPWRRRGRA